MDVVVNLETVHLGTVSSIGGFLLALLFVTIATLDYIQVTNFTKRLNISPEVLFIFSIPLFIIAPLSALGNAISEFWGDVALWIPNLFYWALLIKLWRDRRSRAHKE